MNTSYVLLAISLVLLATSVFGAVTTLTRMPSRRQDQGSREPGRWFQSIAAGIAAVAAVVYALVAASH